MLELSQLAYIVAFMLAKTLPTAKRLLVAAIISICTSFMFADAMAANPVLPGSADAGRVDKDHKQAVPEEAPTEEGPSVPFLPGTEIP
jgi:hypothetical protein